MKETVKCPDCSLCAVGYGVGFAGSVIRYCTKAQENVTDEDGCTLGSEGEPMSLCQQVGATVEGHEAVYGQ